MRSLRWIESAMKRMVGGDCSLPRMARTITCSTWDRSPTEVRRSVSSRSHKVETTSSAVAIGSGRDGYTSRLAGCWNRTGQSNTWRNGASAPGGRARVKSTAIGRNDGATTKQATRATDAKVCSTRKDEISLSPSASSAKTDRCIGPSCRFKRMNGPSEGRFSAARSSIWCESAADIRASRQTPQDTTLKLAPSCRPGCGCASSGSARRRTSRVCA